MSASSTPIAVSAVATTSFALSPARANCFACEVVVDEDVRQDHRPHFQSVIQQALPGEVLQHGRAKPADGAFLDGDQHLVVRAPVADQLLVERLGEARVGDRCWKPEGGELVRCLQSIGEPCAERQDGDVVALAQDPPLADEQASPRAGRATPMPSPRG